MRERMVQIAHLWPADYNPRLIPERELEKLRRSIERFGFVEPIVVNERTMTIVGGHQRVAAAHDLGMAEVPAVFVDLDDVRERQLNLALNAIEGEWDRERLADIVKGLAAAGQDLDATGLDAWELKALRQELAAEGPTAAATTTCPRCGAAVE